jgi:hypothetical protein
MDKEVLFSIKIPLHSNSNNHFIQTATTKVFYSQASWGRLEMKPHELKKAGTK